MVYLLKFTSNKKIISEVVVTIFNDKRRPNIDLEKNGK